MIKARLTAQDGRTLILFGLSEGNLKHLKQDMPVHIHGEELNAPGIDFVIVYGETEEKIVEQLREWVPGLPRPTGARGAA